MENRLLHEDFFNDIRKREYARLDVEGHIYLDYTGGNLYPESLLMSHHHLLRNYVFGNPHSTNPTSQFSSKLVNEGRQKVIDYFNADDYYCIFTQNASGALKIVGECYPFCDDSYFLLLSDNHNSVNGIREYCKNRNGNFSYAKIRHEDLTLDEKQLEADLEEHAHHKHKLFAYPAQSNVTGVKHDLGWIKKAQEKGWDVLLDAAAFVPSSKLDLSKVKPDFVSVSFYKIFGYPTGIGCLLVKKSSFDKLYKRWFAGGTVSLVSVSAPHHFLAKNYERFENGTVNYLDIPAIKTGLEFIESIGIDRIRERMRSLIEYFIDEVNQITYSNGQPVVRVFGPEDRAKAGGTVILSFYDEEGHVLDFENVEAEANKRMISIRSGCFCNPGIDEVKNCITTSELANYFSTHNEGDYYDMIEFLKKMRGATRLSVGIGTTKADIDAFVAFVKEMKDATIVA